ncbi:hypothetical protein [Streptomyces sp. H27-C3]|uniref:hypothetical protein n=1 Tax=Streptomyces sp. H27-C3 TaxID=3046305 RepID=UPI0024B933A4|nr:hypothetical protein [Streptomyces sp. H27-C3]MDJ0460564.1 hypothetical protein [Streptomyces sp. H27-C3]
MDDVSTNDAPAQGVPMDDPHAVITCEDEEFGPVTITTPAAVPDEALVEGPGLPLAVLTRAGEARDHRQAPIGTRDADRLTLTIGDDPATLALGAGRLKRSSFRAVVDLAGLAYTFEPTGRHRSVLRRDGRQVALFIWTGNSESAAIWRPADGVSPRPEDAAVGYLLATAFGTGAASTRSLLLDAVMDAIDAIP